MTDILKLSSEELGKLFPVMLEAYHPEWPAVFLEERDKIKQILGDELAWGVEHFGSTAVAGIRSKPTLDILVEIPGEDAMQELIIKKMEDAGYIYIPRHDCPPTYPMFLKGYTPQGFSGQAFHLHCAPRSHHGLWDRLYFRDYLNNHPEVALEYEQLKIRLAEEFPNDREKYTAGKAEFVGRITKIAMKSQ